MLFKTMRARGPDGMFTLPVFGALLCSVHHVLNMKRDCSRLGLPCLIDTHHKAAVRAGHRSSVNPSACVWRRARIGRFGPSRHPLSFSVRGSFTAVNIGEYVDPTVERMRISGATSQRASGFLVRGGPLFLVAQRSRACWRDPPVLRLDVGDLGPVSYTHLRAH